VAFLPVVDDSSCEISGRAALRDLAADAPVVLPSLLLCDFGNLEREIARLEEAGVRALHLDVMDGHFVPNFTYGFTIVQAVRRLTNLPLDVHLMIEHPERHLERFVDAGADSLSIHIEAVGPEALAAIEQIHDLGASAGVAFNPGTPLEQLDPVLDQCDVVLVMSVEAGFGGQAFLPGAVDRLRTLSQHPRRQFALQVDGGINDSTIGRCAEAGAELFVVGSAIFQHDDYGPRVQRLTQLASTPGGTH
jgi:ribulose-phosphate 3-epimerase